MKLAEALAQRADAQRRIQDLQGRLVGNVLVQEGESPAEELQLLLAELDRSLNRLQTLIGQINRTNLQTELPDGTTLTEALARRDVLKLRFGVLKSAADAASLSMDRFRYSRSEIKSMPAIRVADLRQQADQRAQELRELDVAIQQMNWQVDLAE
jgi:hypothetical protein